eukprot:1159511-Pelagomonas_calceolata.AAC.11
MESGSSQEVAGEAVGKAAGGCRRVAHHIRWQGKAVGECIHARTAAPAAPAAVSALTLKHRGQTARRAVLQKRNGAKMAPGRKARGGWQGPGPGPCAPTRHLHLSASFCHAQETKEGYWMRLARAARGARERVPWPSCAESDRTRHLGRAPGREAVAARVRAPRPPSLWVSKERRVAPCCASCSQWAAGPQNQCGQSSRVGGTAIREQTQLLHRCAA